MKLSASIQWFPPLWDTGTLRVYEVWTEPLKFSATVRRRGDVLKIYAACGEFERRTHVAIYRLAQSLGIRRVKWERYHKGVKVVSRVEILDSEG